jgi:probable DNA metabolism protein
VASLFAGNRESIVSEPDRAERFLAYIAKKASRDVVRQLLWAVMAMPESLEAHLLGYARKAVLHGPCIMKAHADRDVMFVHRHARKVSGEIHRFKGLLRFQAFASGRYVALYEPDYPITMSLAFHFRRRLASQQWMILDCRRQQAATWNGERLNAEMPSGELLSGSKLRETLADDKPTEAEMRSQHLWRTFHQAVAIENRLSSSLQRQFMPARYWKHLTEMQG